MSNILYKNSLINIQIEAFEIPWLKIFTNEPIKEFSHCSRKLQLEILDIINIIEIEMLNYFNPNKINISSFGNFVPHVHFHIQARFENDSYFPESTWGVKQREGNVILKDMNNFYKNITNKLNERNMING